MRANLVTGASDCDPSAVVTSLQVGASTGFSLIWMFPLTTLALIWLDGRAARIASRHGVGISRHLRLRMGPIPAVVISAAFIAANAITIAADISGAASVASNLLGLPRWTMVLAIPIVPAALLYKFDFAAVRRALLLVVPLFGLYLVAAIASRPNPEWSELFPHEISWVLMLGAVGLVGSVLTPYVFFWQVEDSIQLRSRSPQERGSSSAGMVLANLILLAIVVMAASVLYTPARSGFQVDNLRQASAALEPLLGRAAFACFGIGLIASTVVGTPVIAAVCGYAAIGTTGRRAGLNWPVSAARGFYGVAFGVLLLGSVLALSGFNPVGMLLWAQIINGALLPVLVLILVFSTR